MRVAVLASRLWQHRGGAAFDRLRLRRFVLLPTVGRMEPQA